MYVTSRLSRPSLRSCQPLPRSPRGPHLPQAHCHCQASARCRHKPQLSAPAGRPEPLPTFTLYPHTGEKGTPTVVSFWDAKPLKVFLGMDFNFSVLTSFSICLIFSCHDDLQHNKQGLMKGASQGNRNSPSRGLNQKQQTKVTAGLHLNSVHLLNRATKCTWCCMY